MLWTVVWMHKRTGELARCGDGSERQYLTQAYSTVADPTWEFMAVVPAVDCTLPTIHELMDKYRRIKWSQQTSGQRKPPSKSPT
jgi:hypothetical protein